MKSTLIVLILATAIGGATAFFIVQNRAAGERAAELQAALTAKDREVAESQAAAERAGRRVREIASASDQVISNALAREAALSSTSSSSSPPLIGAEAGGGLGKMMGGMFNDPEMRKVIVEQQRTMMRQLYSPLMKKLQLSEEEANAFQGILATNALNVAGIAASIFGSGTNRAGMAKEIAAQSAQMEEEMKSLLGDQRYAEYKEYQQTVGERAGLNMFRHESAVMGDPLSEDQTEQLLVLMRQAKERASARVGQPFPDAGKGQMPKNLSDEQIGGLVDMQAMVNEDVYGNASGVLSPSQLSAFGRFQTNQLQMMRAGLTMARKLMGEQPPAEQ